LISADTGNLLLDHLPPRTAERLLPQLTRSHMERGQILARVGEPIEAVCFPVRCVVSTIAEMANGEAVEVGIAGPEGMSAVSLAYGSLTSTHRSVVQIADSAYCMDASAFLSEMRADVALRETMLAYAEYTFLAATQFAACNRLHPIAERYARWLLMADDRVGGDEFLLTQEYSAQMLGVRRAGVTVIAGQMSQAGLISYRRGHITIRARDSLADASCECYDTVNDELQRLMKYDIRRPPCLERRAPEPGPTCPSRTPGSPRW
jgi:CRP-like cAMP-binding protein